jgi:hypothetical protein
MSDVCRPDVYSKGVCIDVVNVPKEHLEWVCQETTRRIGAVVDWHYVGGRGRVLALGDVVEASRVFQAVMDGVPPDGCLMVVDEKAGRR